MMRLWARLWRRLTRRRMSRADIDRYLAMSPEDIIEEAIRPPVRAEAKRTDWYRPLEVAISSSPAQPAATDGYGSTSVFSAWASKLSTRATPYMTTSYFFQPRQDDSVRHDIH